MLLMINMNTRQTVESCKTDVSLNDWSKLHADTFLFVMAKYFFCVPSHTQSSCDFQQKHMK